MRAKGENSRNEGKMREKSSKCGEIPSMRDILRSLLQIQINTNN
jgi:hypothetical protein